jgi:hypothetical protein
LHAHKEKEGKDMPKLYVKCKECGVKFAAGIAMNRKSFETSTLVGNYHTCPKGHTHLYNKEDYFFPE